MGLKTLLAALAATLYVLPGLGAAQGYPERPVRILVQYPPGGTPDMLARLLADRLTKALGQSFLVENRPGASGNIATDAVAKAAPDGYTLLLASDGPIVINPSLFAKLPFDPLKDLAPVTLIASSGFVLLTAPDFRAGSVQDLLALAKANPGQLNYASSGAGSQHHLAGELFKALGRVQINHVPYKGFGPATIDVMGGRVEMMFGSVPAAVGLINSGKLKPLAVTGAQRFAGWPQVPTLIESGLAGYVINGWYGLMAPAGTPQPIIDKLHAEAARAFRTKEITDSFSRQGLDPLLAGPDAFAERIRTDRRTWAQLVKTANAKLEN